MLKLLHIYCHFV